jgi:hypothetical protein
MGVQDQSTNGWGFLGLFFFLSLLISFSPFFSPQGPPQSRYPVMRDALNATGRPIFFAACEWAVDFPATWMGSVANSWRTTYDVS